MESQGFSVLNNIIDLMFLVDIFVQLRTTYYDPLTGDEIFDKKVIRDNYIYGRFMIDVLATVPLDTITFWITQ
jgi:hypothetical protein